MVEMHGGTKLDGWEGERKRKGLGSLNPLQWHTSVDLKISH
jgi:hypothetical protein